MNLPELQACLDRCGVRLSSRSVAGAPPKLVVDAPAGVLTEELKAALVECKATLLARLAVEPGPTEGPAAEPEAPAAPADWPPEWHDAPRDGHWHPALARWPVTREVIVTERGPRDV